MQNNQTAPTSELKKIVSERLIWQGKLGPAFWTITGVISLTVNLTLIILIILLGQNLFTVKKLLETQLISGAAHQLRTNGSSAYSDHHQSSGHHKSGG